MEAVKVALVEKLTAFCQNAEECQDLNFSEEEMAGIKNLNKQYLVDGEFPFPSRYRPTSGRIFVSPSQDILEEVISKIVRSASHPELVERILAR